MRFERWYWLLVFCILSLGIHTLVGITTPRLASAPAGAPTATITVELDPIKEPEPKKPQPKKPEPRPKPEKRPAQRPRPPQLARRPDAAPRQTRVQARPQRRFAARPAPEPRLPIAEPRPAREHADLGGQSETARPVPLPFGRPQARPERSPRQLARALIPDTVPRPAPDAAPEPAQLAQSNRTSPRLRNRPGALDVENPLASGAPSGPDERPQIASDLGRDVRPSLKDPRPSGSLAGGGRPSPAPLPGRDGLAGPRDPDPDLVYTGGGSGGMKLPQGRARLGGGGGQTVMARNNPLADLLAPDEKPGLSAGSGGGGGGGAGGGLGASRDRGVGTALSGPLLAAERRKQGEGLGAGSGSGVGTRPPGGGAGTGAEVPSVGGSGNGFGGGSGSGLGRGSGAGVGGGGRGGPRLARGGGRGAGGPGGGGGGRAALNRGIPFGDITGLLRGGDADAGGGRGGGPGGPGKGSLAGRGGSPGRAGAVHIVYVVDTSGSMVQGDKIGKAKDALKKAISELKPGDSFNIICFDHDARQFSDQMLEINPANRERALRYVEAIQLKAGTNISAGMERALALRATHIFLLSDGEPSRGITEEGSLRSLVRSRNSGGAQITTLALGLGENFKGIPLLKAIAAENGGQFSYVNLAR